MDTKAFPDTVTRAFAYEEAFVPVPIERFAHMALTPPVQNGSASVPIEAYVHMALHHPMHWADTQATIINPADVIYYKPPVPQRRRRWPRTRSARA